MPDTVDHRWLRVACNAMCHRGPDGEGAWHDEFCGLGHRRLSIIDLQTGAQPMSYADGRYWITFNGEIYNYRQLKSELLAHGQVFRTDSDTEVILAAYTQSSLEAAARLRGIFAFAIWDRREQSLTLVRDHLGVKPLIYSERSGTLRFSSELKGILAADLPRGIDSEALSDYLALGYVLGRKTVVRGIQRLEPGTALVWLGGRSQVQRYWDVAKAAEESGTADASPEDTRRSTRSGWTMR